jgi:CRISPR/Cas system CMR subunit Cmr4 (Cas7 group RAMP superfamily)
MWDMFKELFNPIVRFLVNYFQVIVAVIPQTTWDMSNESGSVEHIKKPVSQSAAIVVMNISSNPIDISNAGIRFKDGEELVLSDFDLPIKIEARNRHEFVLNPKTFEMLKKQGLEKVRYFYVEDPLFQRFKAKLSKKEQENLLATYYAHSKRSMPGD